MAEIIIAVNQTGFDATIFDMGAVVIPASSQVDLGALYPAEFIYRSENLKELVSAGTILMSDGTTNLNQDDSIKFLRQETHYLSRDATSLLGYGILGTTPLNGEVLRYNAFSGLYEPAGVLPTGGVNETLRYDGTNWVSSPSLINDGTNIIVSGSGIFGKQIRIGSSDSSVSGTIQYKDQLFKGYDGTDWSILNQTVFYRYTIYNGVPTAGTRFMQTGEGLFCSTAGDLIARTGKLSYITAKVNVVDTARSFDIQILSNPSGTPTVLATLTLPINTLSVTNTSLSVSVASGTELGARVIRASGTGASTWSGMNVTVGLIQ